jgi:proton-coupled amino acid transporter
VLLTLQSCCVYNMHLLVRLKQHMAREGRGHNYGDLGEFVFGVKGRVAVECFVTIQQIGVCCVYFQFVSANIAAVLVTLGIDPSATRLRRSQLMIAAYFVFAPLGLIRSWKTLAPLSFIANGCIFSGIGIALTYIIPSAVNIIWLALNGDDLQLSLLSESVLPPDAATTGAPLLFGAVIYSFEMICNVLPIENSMAKPERMSTVINISMAIYCTVMYVLHCSTRPASLLCMTPHTLRAHIWCGCLHAGCMCGCILAVG